MIPFTVFGDSPLSDKDTANFCKLNGDNSFNSYSPKYGTR